MTVRLTLLALSLTTAALADARLTLACTPAEVLRGEQVSCRALVTPPQLAVFTERVAVAGGRVLRDASPVRASAGEPFVWEGAAVLPTTVIVRALAGDNELRAEATFDVVARAFPELTLQQVSWEFGPDSLFGGWPPPVKQAPGLGGHVLADGSLGQFRVTITSPRTAYVSSGPDARWFMVEEPAPPPLARVFLSRALRPGDPFYQAQRGELSDDCGAHDLELLRIAVLQHEGAVPGPLPSHYEETKRLFAQERLQRSLEAMVLFLDDAMAGPPLSTRIDLRIRELLDRMTADQRASVDAQAPVRLKCTLRRP